MSGWKLRLFVAIAVVSAAIFIRLGIWQLHRRDERRAKNALVAQRLIAPPVDVADLPKDSALARYRRVRVTGVRDYEHELVYAARTHNGAPGVNLLTPVRLPGSDTAILVNRGWVYSGDGATVDQAKWRDLDTVFVGYVEEFPAVAGTAFANRPTTIARLSRDIVSKALPYPVAPIYVVLLGDSAAPSPSSTGPGQVVRIGAPPLDEGPHFSYAIQWFAFATIALVGAGVVIRQARLAGAPLTVDRVADGDAREAR